MRCAFPKRHHVYNEASRCGGTAAEGGTSGCTGSMRPPANGSLRLAVRSCGTTCSWSGTRALGGGTSTGCACPGGRGLGARQGHVLPDEDQPPPPRPCGSPLGAPPRQHGGLTTACAPYEVRFDPRALRRQGWSLGRCVQPETPCPADRHADRRADQRGATAKNPLPSRHSVAQYGLGESPRTGGRSGSGRGAGADTPGVTGGRAVVRVVSLLLGLWLCTAGSIVVLWHGPLAQPTGWIALPWHSAGSRARGER